MTAPGTDPHDPTPMGDIVALLAAMQSHPNFAWSKINHGFWEALGDVEQELGWPVPPDRYPDADRIARRPSFFVGGFVDQLLEAMAAPRHDHMVLAFELSAWPGDNSVIGTPFRPEVSRPMLDRYAHLATPGADGLLLKRAVGDGSIRLLFDALADRRVVVVGPEYLSGLAAFAGISESTFVPIHPQRARDTRDETESSIVAALAAYDGDATVLVQAGTLAPYWILRLRPRFPSVRWLDGGLAFSISHPEDILRRPWGKAHRAGIVRTYNAITTGDPIPEQARVEAVAVAVEAVAREVPSTSDVRFVHDDRPDLDRVAEFLEISGRHRQWANRGPLVRALERASAAYMGVGPGRSVAAVANGGLALEALARLIEHRRGSPLRWGVSAFTFKNQNRGYFAHSVVIDCDGAGMLDLATTERALDDGAIDGFVVTNIFGLWREFRPYVDLARRRAVPMVIDNAAGMGPSVPDWEFQAFSLHHTKPYGFGEGGLAIVPADERTLFDQLLSYGDLAADPHLWVNNGKVSEVAAAHHLDRLERAAEWRPFFEMQSLRIAHLADRCGLRPLVAGSDAVAMSVPFLAPRPVDVAELANHHVTLGKYYVPLVQLPMADLIYRHIVNVPTHPDVAHVEESDLLAVLRRLGR